MCSRCLCFIQLYAATLGICKIYISNISNEFCCTVEDGMFNCWETHQTDLFGLRMSAALIASI